MKYNKFTTKQMLEFAGVDTTKGKAKLLVEAEMHNAPKYFTHTFIIEDGEEFNKAGPISPEEQASFHEGQKFPLPKEPAARNAEMIKILHQFIEHCGPHADKVKQDMNNDSDLNEFMGIVMGNPTYHTIVMWSVEYDVNMTACA